jgi:hypothetical protein
MTMTITLRNLTFAVRPQTATIEAQVGNTPLIGFRRITAHLPANVAIYAKAEWHNPGGSVKDRAALNIIRTAEERGLLTPGKTILDSTSGNTGIALAMFGAARGYPVRLFLPENASPERIQILRAYGAELSLTDPLAGADGAQVAARALAAAEPDRYSQRRPVQTTGQLAGPLPWHGAGNLGADLQTGHPLRGRPGHQRHVRRHGPPPEGAQPDPPGHLAPARFPVQRPGRHEAHADRHPARHLRPASGRRQPGIGTEAAYACCAAWPAKKGFWSESAAGRP